MYSYPTGEYMQMPTHSKDRVEMKITIDGYQTVHNSVLLRPERPMESHIPGTGPLATARTEIDELKKVLKKFQEALRRQAYPDKPIMILARPEDIDKIAELKEQLKDQKMWRRHWVQECRALENVNKEVIDRAEQIEKDRDHHKLQHSKYSTYIDELEVRLAKAENKLQRIKDCTFPYFNV